MIKSSSQNLTSGLRCKGWKFYHRSFAPEFNPSFVIFRVNFLALQNYKEFDGTIEKTKQTKLKLGINDGVKAGEDFKHGLRTTDT